MTKDFVTNRYGEKFYVGDRVCFMGQEGHEERGKIIARITDHSSWVATEGGSPWISDNLVLIERLGEVSEGWTL